MGNFFPVVTVSWENPELVLHSSEQDNQRWREENKPLWGTNLTGHGVIEKNQCGNSFSLIPFSPSNFDYLIHGLCIGG